MRIECVRTNDGQCGRTNDGQPSAARRSTPHAAARRTPQHAVAVPQHSRVEGCTDGCTEATDWRLRDRWDWGRRATAAGPCVGMQVLPYAPETCPAGQVSHLIPHAVPTPVPHRHAPLLPPLSHTGMPHGGAGRRDAGHRERASSTHLRPCPDNRHRRKTWRRSPPYAHRPHRPPSPPGLHPCPRPGPRPRPRSRRRPHRPTAVPAPRRGHGARQDGGASGNAVAARVTAKPAARAAHEWRRAACSRARAGVLAACRSMRRTRHGFFQAGCRQL